MIASRAVAWQRWPRLFGSGDLERARPGRWTAVALGACVALAPRLAAAHVGDDELFARLAWLVIIPLAAVQLMAAGLIKRRTEESVAGRIAIASGIAFILALGATAAIEDRRSLMPVIYVLYFVPGLPALVVLARQRLWGAALLLFLAAPLPLVALSV
jgi:hypothetical protein